MTQFNPEQEAAVRDMQAFLQSSDQFFLLSGSAGTGKTFCIKHLIEQCPKLKVVFTAPTNKATKVITSTITTDDYFPVTKTTYSLLGLRLEPNGEIKELKVSERRQNLENYKVVIVDEASMISAKLWEQIRRAADEFTIKFIFMGDRSQLPPVKEAFSPIWEYVDQRAELTQVMRFDNQLLALATQIREQVDKPLPSIKLVSDNNEVEGIWREENGGFIKRLQSAARSGDFTREGVLVKAIAWRNIVVRDMNQLIRNQIFDNSKECVWLPGDRIILTAPANNIEGEPMACTDEEGTIERVFILNHPLFHEFLCYNLSVLGDGNKRLNLWVLHESALKQFEAEKLRLVNEAKAQPRKWKDYWNFVDTFHQIQYGYAITAHRAQGSTYDTAYVDWRDILSNRNRNEGFRCFYVACTRAKRKLILGSMG